MSYVLILGAKSDMAKSVVKKYAQNNYNLYLACRNSKEIEGFSKDVAIRNEVIVECLEFDVLNYEMHKSFYENLEIKPIGVISFIGLLGDEQKAQSEFFQESKRVIDTNFTGIVSIFNIISSDFEKRKSGFIVGVSSVAGDRGRKKNYIYGSAKAGFTAYLSGLRNRLYNSNVHVLTVKPGFVYTKMTEHLDLPQSITSHPDNVANDIFKAQQGTKNIIYTKWIWKYIMFVIKNIPEFFFKKLNI